VIPREARGVNGAMRIEICEKKKNHSPLKKEDWNSREGRWEVKRYRLPHHTPSRGGPRSEPAKAYERRVPKNLGREGPKKTKRTLLGREETAHCGNPPVIYPARGKTWGRTKRNGRRKPTANEKDKKKKGRSGSLRSQTTSGVVSLIQMPPIYNLRKGGGKR